MPTSDDVTALLLDAHARAALVEPPSASNPAFDLPAAHVVGVAITARHRARGERTVGRKIGFTNAGIWEEYRVDAPLWAHIYDTTLRRSPEGSATLSLSGMTAPRIEPELVLGIRTAPPGDDPTPEALLRSVAWVSVGFEVVDCHFADWRFSLADAVADFGLHAALVIGTPLLLEPGREEHLLDALVRCALTLRRNAATIATGVGANALGSPLLALGHLVRTLAAQGAEAPGTPAATHSSPGSTGISHQSARESPKKTTRRVVESSCIARYSAGAEQMNSTSLPSGSSTYIVRLASTGCLPPRGV